MDVHSKYKGQEKNGNNGDGKANIVAIIDCTS